MKLNEMLVSCVAAFAAAAANATVKTAADYDVGDYVQDGLVAHYDGIRNAGSNLPHDPNATVWKDLASDNFLIFSGTDSVAAASGEWTGGNSYSFACSYGLMNTAVDLGENITVQLALDVDFDAQTASYAATGNKRPTYATYVGSGGDYGVFTRPASRTSLEWKADTWCGGTRAKYSGWNGRYINLIATNDYSYAGQNAVYEGAASRAKTVAFDGIKWSVGGAHLASNASGVDIRLSMSRFYAARFYSRPLSEAELARNRKVDEIRFRGAIYTNVVVEASSYAGVAGTEAAGVYEVVGSHTFTAPDVTVGAVTYRAEGYTVETWNGSYWASAARFSGNSYTYVATGDDPVVRLTWLWKPCGIRAAGDYDACDYVQGGLVAQYDGIRNVGMGLPHDPAATVWNDLRSDNYMAFDGTDVVAAATGSWTNNNAYFFAGHSYARMAEAISMGSNVTVQLAVDIDNAAQVAGYNTLFDQWLRVPLYFAAEADYGVFANIYSSTQTRYLQWKDKWTGSGASAGRANFNGWNYKYLTGVMTDEKAYLFQTEDYGGNSFTRTKFLPLENLRWSLSGSYGTAANMVQRYSIGKYHSARFYNRALTSEELAWNRKVDEIRFRGVVCTNVVVASAKPEAQGVQPNGVYEVLAEGTFTAEPVAGVRNGNVVTYVPTGYTVEHLTGGAWGAPESHDGTSYTYNAETEGGAPVRLTWKWRTEGLGVILIVK